MFKETIAAYSENKIKHVITLWMKLPSIEY